MAAQTLIQRTLEERKKVLRDTIAPAPEEGLPIGSGAGRAAIIPLVPDGPTFAGLKFCQPGSREEDITEMLNFAIQRHVSLNLLSGQFCPCEDPWANLFPPM